VPEGKAPAKGGETTASEGLASFLEARAFAYDILKRAFLQEPSEKFIKLLIEGEIIQAFPFADSKASLGRAINRIVKYLKLPDVLSRKKWEILHWDYTRMFIGPGKVPAPPWESIYRDADHLYFSQETQEVRNTYRKYNLLPKDLGHQPDDHLGLELDFLHKLCEMAREKAKSADETGLMEILNDQKAFLDEHLLKWVPDWTRDVVKSAETDFYKGMAQLLEAYLNLDREMIEELLEAPSQKLR
jgi:TorA maturation chaperone TorD